MKNIKISRSNRIWITGFLIASIFGFYWLFIASDQYHSNASVIVQMSDTQAPDLSMSSLLSGSSGQNKADLLLLQEYMLSIGMLEKLEKEFGLIKHYSSNKIDYFSRFTGKKDSIEYFYHYFKKQINVNIDDYTGVLKIKVNAFNPSLAKEVADYLLAEGETKINGMNHDLAHDQVVFIENHIQGFKVNLDKQKNEILDYQNKNNILSPESEIASLEAVINQMKSKSIMLKAERDSLLSMQSHRSSAVMKLNSEIKALDRQIKKQRAKLSGISEKVKLNEKTAEYKALTEKLSLTEELYGNALLSLEKLRVDSARSLKKIAVIQEATESKYSVHPDRTVKAISYFMVTMLITWVFYMFYVAFIDRRVD